MGLKSETGEKGAAPVKSAARALEVLEFLAARGGVPARLTDVAQSLGAPRSSVHALMRTLTEAGWVRTDVSGAFYALGVRCLLVGTSILDSDPYVRVARPILSDLRDRLGETVHLARIDEGNIVYLATFESPREVRPFTRVGRAMPAHCTSLGKALLAVRQEVPREPLVALTPHTVTDLSALKEELSRIATQGYALDDEENTLGISCVGVALRYTFPATDAISCSVPTSRMDDAHRATIIDALIEAVARIEQSAPVQGAM